MCFSILYHMCVFFTAGTLANTRTLVLLAFMQKMIIQVGVNNVAYFFSVYFSLSCQWPTGRG